MRYGVRSLTDGMAKLGQVLGGGGRLMADARAAEEARLLKAAIGQQQLDKLGYENAAADAAHTARGSIGEDMGALLRAAGQDPSLGAAMANLYLASGGNAAQLGDFSTDAVNLMRTGAAVDEADPTRSNRLLVAGGRSAYTPWSQTAGGLAIDTGSGRQVQSSPAARATIGKTMADTYAANQLGVQRGAAADLYDARGAREVAGMAVDAAQAEAHRALAAERTAGGARQIASIDGVDAARAEAHRALARQREAQEARTIGQMATDAAMGRAADSLAGQRDAATVRTGVQTEVDALEADTERARTEATRALAELRRAQAAGEERDAASGGFDYGPSDSNAMYRQVAAAFGGIYDPMTNTIAGIDPSQAGRIQAIVSRAEAIYIENRGAMGHAQAVEQAMLDAEIQVPQLAGRQPPPVTPQAPARPVAPGPFPLDPAADPSDPLGILK